MDKISLVVPCYNEEEVLGLFYEEAVKIAALMPEQAFEFLFVDDGSTDKTLNILKDMHSKDERVRFISFSRNFGKESGMFAGLQHATGDYVAVMDADLQDPLTLVHQMYNILKTEDYDCVATCRSTRKGEPCIRSFFARQFYKLINKVSKTQILDGARDFRLMSRKMVDAILSVGEYNRFSKEIFCWVGFKTKWISYDNVERAAGKSKWSFWRLFTYALDGIAAFTTMPLVMSSIMGLFFFLMAFIILIVIIIKTWVYGDPVTDYPALLCIIFFIAGIQLFCIGIMGQYLSKAYLETKKRPAYIIRYDEKDMDRCDGSEHSGNDKP